MAFAAKLLGVTYSAHSFEAAKRRRRRRGVLPLILFAAIAFGGGALAQSEDAASAPAAEEAIPEEPAYTEAELQTLVAPVALFPDTLLIQILVATTEPFEVLKADRLLLENEGATTEELTVLIEAEEYDISVEVLAEAFPDVIHAMASSIDWTETLGDAMSLQSDDVMEAVQVMRLQAINTGALVSNEAQQVEQDPESDVVVIQPTDPNVVYVPQYDAQAVYDTNFGVGDAVAAGLITYAAITIIDEIFDDDDDWNDYWGCRNCGGWGGGPIIRDPDIDIDIDGNVNIGNEINIDRDDIRDRVESGEIEIGDDTLRRRIEDGEVDRDELRDRIDSGEIEIPENGLRDRVEGGWEPDTERREAAAEKVGRVRDTPGAPSVPGDRVQLGEQDELRAKLSEQSRSRGGGGDLSFEGVAGTGAVGAGAGAVAARRGLEGGSSSRPTGIDRDALRSNTPARAPVAKPSAKKKPVAKPAQRSSAKASPKIAKKAGGQRGKAASSRGKSGGKKIRRR